MSATRLAVAALVGLLLVLQAFALVRSPDAWYPAAIAVQLAPNDMLTVGRAELAASGAQAEHVQLRRDAAGDWFVRMLPGARAPVVGDTRMGAVDTAGLRTFQVGAAVFRLRQASTPNPGRIEFTDGARAWRYDGATLYRDGAALAPCPDAPLSRRLVALWNRAVPQALTAARPLLVGGNLYCGNRLGLADIAAGAAVIARMEGKLRLTAAADGITPVLADASDLRAQELPLGEARTLSVGATRYRVDLARDTLTLAPERRIALFAVPDVRLPAGVTWHWRQHSLWRGNAIAWTTALLAMAALLAPWLTAFAGARRLPARGNILPPGRLAQPWCNCSAPTTRASSSTAICA